MACDKRYTGTLVYSGGEVTTCNGYKMASNDLFQVSTQKRVVVAHGFLIGLRPKACNEEFSSSMFSLRIKLFCFDGH